MDFVFKNFLCSLFFTWIDFLSAGICLSITADILAWKD